MKKVVVFVGSARRKHTQNAAEQFLRKLQALGEVECEIVRLSEQHLEICRGCILCFNQGEGSCPSKDDRDLLLEKMMAADGVVLASPNYSFQVSAITKVFLDRLGFVFHRPRFFGKVFTSIVVQGIFGGSKIVSYLDLVGNGLGFTTVKGTCLTSLEPMTDKQLQKNDRLLESQSRRFLQLLGGPRFPSPSLLKLMLFRMQRTSVRRMLDESFCDYRYYRDKGWFESSYYYPVRLNAFKRVAGAAFDRVAAHSARVR
ncbi:MAG: Iron-sulfur flavoprotein [Candidatus Latescibacteria bacterium ADurb.Bin168]|nr:MAG: Iron-sulfur flavoprotein [Candidatus Latescibacteria bacterium ADurb.Bin168]